MTAPLLWMSRQEFLLCWEQAGAPNSSVCCPLLGMSGALPMLWSLAAFPDITLACELLCWWASASVKRPPES